MSGPQQPAQDGEQTRRLFELRSKPTQALAGQALAHGYDTAFWWTAGILAVGSIVAGILFRRGPLVSRGTPGTQAAGEVEIGAGPAISA